MFYDTFKNYIETAVSVIVIGAGNIMWCQKQKINPN